MSYLIIQGGHKTWTNLEFNNLGKNKPGKTWNLRNFENNLEKPGILYKSHQKT